MKIKIGKLLKKAPLIKSLLKILGVKDKTVVGKAADGLVIVDKIVNEK